MVYLLNMRTNVAVGTSLFRIVFVSAATTMLLAISLKSVDIVLGAILILGGVLGSNLGAKAGSALKGEQLRLLLVLLVLGVCVRLAVDLIERPDEIYSLRPIAVE